MAEAATIVSCPGLAEPSSIPVVGHRRRWPARELVEGVNEEKHRLPVVFFPDGTVLIEPDNRSLAEKIVTGKKFWQSKIDKVMLTNGLLIWRAALLTRDRSATNSLRCVGRPIPSRCGPP